MSVKVVVLGAGISGLSTAVNIQDKIPSAQVTIIADGFYQDTTSYVAAGSFRYTHLPKENRRELEERICWNSFNHFWQLATSEKAKESGVSIMPMFDLYMEKNPPLPMYSKMVKSFRRMDQKELLEYGFPDRFPSEFSFTTTITECRFYLPYLMKLFESKGGTFIQKKLNNLDDVKLLSRDYDIIVNCSALGSRELFNDKEVYPVRGQIFKINAPWIKISINTADTVYFYTARDGLVVGGVRQKDDWNKNIRKEDSEYIMKRASEFYPSIRNAEIIREVVGLRPTRDTLRIEIETITSDDRSFPVVHNYGHGAHGIALSWGSGVEATNLVKKLLTDMTLRSRL